VIEKFLAELQLAGCEPSDGYTAVALSKYYARRQDGKNAKKYWFMAKEKFALLDPADSHPTILLMTTYDPSTALDMFNHLAELRVVPLRKTFNVLIESHKKRNLHRQAKILEQHRFRSFD